MSYLSEASNIMVLCMQKKPLILLIAIIAILASITLMTRGIIFNKLGMHEETGLNLVEFRKYGSLIELNQPAPRVEIGTTEGKMTIPIPGKVNVMTPQYTHCPDICPLETIMMLYVMNKTIEYGYEDQVIFITINVDPWRDDADIAKQYMQQTAGRYLDRVKWIWMVDTPENMKKVWDAYKVAVEKDFETGLVAHTGGFYIIDKEGQWRYFVAPSTEGWSQPKEFAKGLWVIVKSVIEGRELQ